MNNMKVPALVLIVGGVLGLIYGSFTYTKVTHEAKVGSLQVTYNEKSTVYIPIAVSVGGIALGTMLLLMSRRKV